MPAPSHITVTAPPDRATPIDKDDGREPGGGQLRVTSDFVYRVRFAGSHTVRRSLARGDLIACDMNGAPVEGATLLARAERAAAPDELPGGRLEIKRPGSAVAGTFTKVVAK